MEEAAPEAEEDYFYHTQNSVSYVGGTAEKSADQETANEPAVPVPESGGSLTFRDDELAEMREKAYVLHGMSADSYLTAWGSKVADGLYCIDPSLLKNLPTGLSLSADDEARLYADEAPFVYILVEGDQ